MKEFNMKKLLYVLFTASLLMLFPSCVYVGDKPPVVVVEPLFYSITFVNNTEENVIDWYVHVKDSNKKIAISSDFCPVPSGTASTLGWLPRNNYYQVRFALYPEYTKIYTTGTYIYLDENVEYKLMEKSYSGRSAGASEIEKSPEFYLLGSDGSEIPLITETEEPRA